MIPPTLPLDYAPAKRWRRKWSVPTVIPLYLLVFLIIFLSAVAVPRFELIFKHFQVNPPAFTKVVFFVSRVIAGDFGWVLLLPLPWLVARWLRNTSKASDDFKPPSFWGTRSDLIVLLLLLLIAGFFLIGLLLPMMPLVVMVSGPPAKH